VKKSEVKAASNEELIIHLVHMTIYGRILKSHRTCAKWISEELAHRGVVDSPEFLFKQWDLLYTG